MFPLDTTTRAGRMMEAGRVTVTFRSVRTGEHITLTAKARGKDEATDQWISTPLADALVVFIEVPNQEGWNDKVGKVTRRAGFTPDRNADAARAFCARQLLNFLAGSPMPAGLEAHEESRCGRCGRQLTDPVSIERGIGPECYGRRTGSKHETKGSPAGDPSIMSPTAPDAFSDLRRDYGDGPADMPAPERKRDRSRGYVNPSPDAAAVRGVSGWRAKQATTKAALKAEATGRGIRSGRKLTDPDRPSSQNRVFPTTGDAIPY